MHALVALGPGRARDISFYAGMKEVTPHRTSHGSNPTDSIEIHDTNTKVENDDSIGSQNTDIMDCDEGRENLDLIVNIMEEQETEEREKLKQDVMTLGNVLSKMFKKEHNNSPFHVRYHLILHDVTSGVHFSQPQWILPYNSIENSIISICHSAAV